MNSFRSRSSSTTLICGALLCTVLATNARAGVVIESTVKDPRLGGSEAMLMEIDGDRLRVDPPDQDKDEVRTSMIFDGSRNALTILDHREKTAIEMDQAMVEGMMVRLAEAKKQLQAQLAEMPPEQRKMMEQMMEQRGAGAMLGGAAPKPRPPLTLKPSGETRHVGGRECAVSTLQRANEKVGEACIASFSALGISREDIAALSEMADFQKHIAEQFRGSGMPDVSDELELFRNLKGLPLQTIRREANGTETRSDLVKIEKVEIPASRFEIPAGYEKREMPKS